LKPENRRTHNMNSKMGQEKEDKTIRSESRPERLDTLKSDQLQAWTGREGSRRLMLPDFTTIGT